MTTLAMLAITTQGAPAVERVAGGLTIYSGLFMLISMGLVTLLTIWCYSRIIATKKHFDPDGTGPARPAEAGDVETEEVS